MRLSDMTMAMFWDIVVIEVYDVRCTNSGISKERREHGPSKLQKLAFFNWLR
jgi:hypothetical protein